MLSNKLLFFFCLYIVEIKNVFIFQLFYLFITMFFIIVCILYCIVISYLISMFKRLLYAND